MFNMVMSKMLQRLSKLALQGEYIDNRPVRLDYSIPKQNPGNGNQRGGFSRGGSSRGGSGRGGFNSRGGSGRGGFGGNRSREFGSGSNSSPLGAARQNASFQGTKKTFD